MTTEKQATCRELSEKLKKLGYPQKGACWWIYNKLKDKWKFSLTLTECIKNHSESWDYVVAPTLPELLEKIPSPLSLGGSELYFGMGKDKDTYHCGYCFDDGTWVYYEDSIWEGDKEYELYIEDEKRLVDGVAKILIYSLKHKIIKKRDLK